jgi:hypothetical protein
MPRKMATSVVLPQAFPRRRLILPVRQPPGSLRDRYLPPEAGSTSFQSRISLRSWLRRSVDLRCRAWETLVSCLRMKQMRLQNSFNLTSVLLYPVTEREDRTPCLKRAFQVLGTGGVLLAAAIRRFASRFDWLARGGSICRSLGPMVDRDLRHGQHRNPTGKPKYFTTACFRRPDELVNQRREAASVCKRRLGSKVRLGLPETSTVCGPIP